MIRTVAREHGLSAVESELIKVRASQVNCCAVCLDLHAREARRADVAQPRLDLMPAWRETAVFDEREKAVLAIADACTSLSTGERSVAELTAARAVLGDDAFAAAEWDAVTINVFNRISILSEHPVRPRDADGELVH